ncbi:MAG: helix-turn-helix domain-containing protein [Firmicutes bacterium]|nr:helix-turn-helix domain-containing protein [Bacillota bacterium]
MTALFYTAPEVARMLRVKKAYVYELVAMGKLKALRLSERRLRIPEEALKEYLEAEYARQEKDRARAN